MQGEKNEKKKKKLEILMLTYIYMLMVLLLWVFFFFPPQGSGHMVPTDKPRPALELFINFIQNKPF